MECRKWEDFGLLYSAQELQEQEKREYEEHLKECEECRKELYYYRREHERFFTTEMLGETPSPKVDAEILRVCADPRVRMTTSFLFAPLFRKALLPAAVFLIGFVSVGYLMLNMQNAGQIRAMAAKNQAATVAIKTEKVPKADSLKDSLHGTDVNYARNRGNLNDKGVMTVDLKK